jgi:hypothetical protein
VRVPEVEPNPLSIRGNLTGTERANVDFIHAGHGTRAIAQRGLRDAIGRKAGVTSALSSAAI